MSDVPEDRLLRDAIARIASEPEFASRHGSFRQTLGALGSPASSESQEAIHARVQERLDSAPNHWGLALVGATLQEPTRHPGIAGNKGVTELCTLLGGCASSITMTEQHPVKAFSDIFGRAVERVWNKRIADERHAKKNAILEECWQNFKKGGFRSVKEAAVTFAKHYASDRVTVRGIVNYFRKRAKEEGIRLKPGRRPAREPKKQKG